MPLNVVKPSPGIGEAKPVQWLPPNDHNNPPTPFDTIKIHIDDLYDEAKQWLDGEPIDSQPMADAVNGLIVQIKEAHEEADTLRKAEAKPHDDAKTEIQVRYNALIGKTKTVTGKTVLALEVAKEALTPWLRKLDAIQRENERRARVEAETARAAAETAFRESQPDDLGAREDAEHLLDDAKEAEAIATKAAKATPTAKGGAGRATGLRSYWRAEIVDRTEFAKHLWTTMPPVMDEFLNSQAKRMVDANHDVAIPGVVIHEDKRAV